MSLRASFTMPMVLPARTIVMTWRAGGLPSRASLTVYLEVVMMVLACALLGWKRSHSLS